MRIPIGGVALRMPLFQAAGEELRSAVEPPWPQWMRDLYGLSEKQDPDIDAAAGQTTISAAVAALAARLHHRLELLAWVAGALEDSGWTLHIDGDALVATRVANPHHAQELLEVAGISGALCAVAEIDEDGWPRLRTGPASTA